jgi:hypothetical protein
MRNSDPINQAVEAGKSEQLDAEPTCSVWRATAANTGDSGERGRKKAAPPSPRGLWEGGASAKRVELEREILAVHCDSLFLGYVLQDPQVDD